MLGPVLVSGAILHKGIEQLEADWDKVPISEVISFSTLSDLCLQVIQYYVIYVSRLFILALVFCPAWAAPVNFLGQSLGAHIKHSKLPHLRGCLVLLLADSGSCAGEK